MTFSVYSASVKSPRSGLLYSMSQSLGLGLGLSLCSSLTRRLQRFLIQGRIFNNHRRFRALHTDTRHCYTSVRLSVCLSVASRSQRVSLIVIPFCLSGCRSFRDLQPTTIDRSQPNLVSRYIPVLGPV